MKKLLLFASFLVLTASLFMVGVSAATTHTVVRGDSLWAIAKKYLGNGSRYPEIKALNDLTSNTIYSGWKLKIPN